MDPNSATSRPLKGNAATVDDEARRRAAARLKTPALALAVISMFGIAFAVLFLALQLAMLATGMEIEAVSGGNPAMKTTMKIVVPVLIAVANGMIFVGSLKMRKLTGYGLAKAAAVLAIVPLFAPCLLLGIPFGIWALMVLSDQQVRSAFR